MNPVALFLAVLGVLVMALRAAKSVLIPNPPGWGPMVEGVDRLAGVDGRLIEGLWRRWSFEGPHVMVVAGGLYGGHVYVGGVRDLAQQLSDAALGLSKATGPETAPHMHAGATDGWPKGFRPDRSFEQQDGGPEVGETYRQQFLVWAEYGRARGFVSGEGWGDLPHHEVPDWHDRPVGPDPSTLNLS